MLNSRRILRAHYRHLLIDYYVGQSLSCLVSGVFLIFETNLNYWPHFFGLILAVSGLLLLISTAVPRFAKWAQQINTMLSGTIINLTLFCSILPVLLDNKNPGIEAVLVLIELWALIFIVVSIKTIVIFFSSGSEVHFKFRFYKTETISTLNVLALIFTISAFISMVLNICNPFQFMAFAVVILLARLLADIYMSPPAPPVA